jgi:hypothetical protein
MDFEKTPTLTAQVRGLLLWLCVCIAYAGWIAVILLVMLQMTSGYGSSFLGTGTPPNTVEFRRAVGQFVVLAYLLSTGGAVFAIWYGDGTVRWAAAIPATLSALALLLTVIGKLA